MKTVALHLSPKDVRRQGPKNGNRDSHCPAEDYDSAFSKILVIIALTAVFFGLLSLLPMSAARAESNELPPLPYEVRDPIVPGKLSVSPFVPPPPQWQQFEQMSKDDQRALLAQLAIGAIGTAIHHPVGRALKAVQEPIVGENVKCRTKLSFKTYYMRCGLKF